MLQADAKAKAKDDADIASEQEQRARDEALWKAGRYSRLQFRGKCYNCGETCEGAFCDVGCRQDYEREQRVKARQGREGWV
jgi:heterodisulfide reductase subunit C